MNILKSLKFAIKGILYAVKNERNMRIHTVVAVYVLMFSLFFNMSVLRYSFLILIIAVVIMAEMFNSSIENLIDLCSKDYNSAAKAAKDIAAGSVLVVSGAAAVCGFIIFSEPGAYIRMWAFFRMNPWAVLLVFLLSLFSYVYIFWGPTEIKNKMKNLILSVKKFSKIDN